MTAPCGCTNSTPCQIHHYLLAQQAAQHLQNARHWLMSGRGISMFALFCAACKKGPMTMLGTGDPDERGYECTTCNVSGLADEWQVDWTARALIYVGKPASVGTPTNVRADGKVPCDCPGPISMGCKAKEKHY